jgi:hypothetical protein
MPFSCSSTFDPDQSTKSQTQVDEVDAKMTNISLQTQILKALSGLERIMSLNGANRGIATCALDPMFAE